MKISIEKDRLLDCGEYPVAVELTAENMPLQVFKAQDLIGADVMKYSITVDSEEYKKAVMTELKRRMPNLNSIQKKKDGKIYAVSRTYQNQHVVDFLMVISADPAPHRDFYLFYS